MPSLLTAPQLIQHTGVCKRFFSETETMRATHDIIVYLIACILSLSLLPTLCMCGEFVILSKACCHLSIKKNPYFWSFLAAPLFYFRNFQCKGQKCFYSCYGVASSVCLIIMSYQNVFNHYTVPIVV